MADLLPACDRCGVQLHDPNTLRWFVCYFAVHDPPTGAYEIEATDQTLEELLAQLRDVPTVEIETDISERGSLLLCGGCIECWTTYLNRVELSRSKPQCALCFAEIAVKDADLWAIFYRAVSGTVDGEYLAVSGAEVQEELRRLSGEAASKSSGALPPAVVQHMCSSCYRQWIHDPADAPDIG